MLLTREQILNAVDVQTERVEVPEWGGAVLVRGMSGAERDAFEAAIIQQRGKNSTINFYNIRAKLVALSVVDADGNRLFSDADIKALGQKSAVALQRVFEVAQRLSGLRDEDVDELSKNSENGQSEDSTFAWPSLSA